MDIIEKMIFLPDRFYIRRPKERKLESWKTLPHPFFHSSSFLFSTRQSYFTIS